MQKIIIATNNPKKLAEITDLMGMSNVQFCSLSDLNIESCPEPFDTFIENALAKARHASKKPACQLLLMIPVFVLTSLRGAWYSFSKVCWSGSY